jgi:predicted aspartyl protease
MDGRCDQPAAGTYGDPTRGVLCEDTRGDVTAMPYTAGVGHIHVDAKLTAARERIVRMLADTGATYSFVDDAIASDLGAPRLPTPVRLTLADGSVRECQVALVKINLAGREAAATLVVMPVAEPLLGVEALEGLGLAPDPKAGGLVPTRAAAVILASVIGRPGDEGG